MMDFGGPYPMAGLFVPDGSVDPDDRYHLLMLYSGFVFSDSIPIAIDIILVKGTPPDETLAKGQYPDILVVKGGTPDETLRKGQPPDLIVVKGTPPDETVEVKQ